MVFYNKSVYQLNFTSTNFVFVSVTAKIITLTKFPCDFLRGILNVLEQKIFGKYVRGVNFHSKKNKEDIYRSWNALAHSINTCPQATAIYWVSRSPARVLSISFEKHKSDIFFLTNEYNLTHLLCQSYFLNVYFKS